MKKLLLLVLIAIVGTGGAYIYPKVSKFLPFYDQLTKEHVSLNKDLQPHTQKMATFVGPSTCKSCHKKEFTSWSHSMHPKMIQDIKRDPSVVVADFSTLPKDADFNLSIAKYTVGSKFKQRFMIPMQYEAQDDFRLGNYQYNVETKQWQPFKPWKYWYHDAYEHNNSQFPTSRACDGCHFTGFMSREERVFAGISCENCHGPGSLHVDNPKEPLYLASLSDPVRQNEVCLQCHMRNRDKRLDEQNISSIVGDARDYPFGYEPGQALTDFKRVAPFKMGHASKEFYANGAAKKNRTQGNEFVRSIKSHHGITCINCHSPHSLAPTAQHDLGGNALCLRCHSFGSAIGPHQANLTSHTHHAADSKGSRCIECHMPKTGRHTGKSPLSVRSHLFGFTTPAETAMYNMPKETNACFACHSDKTLQTLQNELKAWGMIAWDKQERVEF